MVLIPEHLEIGHDHVLKHSTRLSESSYHSILHKLCI
jgi:hypothetical protein